MNMDKYGPCKQITCRCEMRLSYETGSTLTKSTVLSRFNVSHEGTSQFYKEAPHVKGANSSRWFRVCKGFNLVKGRGRRQEKVVD